MSSPPNINDRPDGAAGDPRDGGRHSAPDAKERLDSRDIANTFLLFLGRKPTDITSASFDGDMEGLLQEAFHEEEFRTSVLTAVLLREELPHAGLGDAPQLKLIDWAQRRLPLTAATRLALGGARTWAQLLELLLADGALLTVAPYLAEAKVDGFLRQRLENEPWARIKRSVIGSVDAASGFEMRG